MKCPKAGRRGPPRLRRTIDSDIEGDVPILRPGPHQFSGTDGFTNDGFGQPRKVNAMAGLIGEIRKGMFSKDENIVFVHTGGSAALFAYEALFSEKAA